MPSAGQSAKQRPIRTIIYFQGPAAENKQLTSAISEACNCQPVFFRRYLDDALIYEILLPQDETFTAFEKQLMLNVVPLGIKAVEQDTIMRAPIMVSKGKCTINVDHARADWSQSNIII